MRNDTTVNFLPGANILNNVTYGYTSTGTVSGGNFSFDFFGSGGSTGVISAGNYELFSVNGFPGGDWVLNGGTFSTISCQDRGNLEIHGAQTAPGMSFEVVDWMAVDSPSATIYGTGFNYDYGDISDLSGTLTGTLENEDPIDWVFLRDANSTITLVAPVPEPSTWALSLLGLTVIAALRRRRAA